MIIPHRPIDYYREYYVSLWVGQFPSIEEVDAYFTEEYDPDHWEPSPFAIELELDYYPPEYLEIHFEEKMVLRPLLTLLMEATFSESFLHHALAAARDQGIYEAQGIALLYNFDYQSKPNSTQTVGPMRFIGAFAFDPRSLKAKYHEIAEQAGCSVAAVWFVLAAFQQFSWERRQEQGKEGHASAREFCAFLQSAQGKTTAEIFKWWLPRRIADELRKQGDACAESDAFFSLAQPFRAGDNGKRGGIDGALAPSPRAAEGTEGLKAQSPVHATPSPALKGWANEKTAPERVHAPEQRSVAAILRELRLLRSEDVGRVFYALVDAQILQKQESDSRADFHGLFNLEQ